MDNSTMSNRDVLSDGDGLAGVAMQYSPVLHVAAFVNADAGQIGPGDSSRPEAAAWCQADIPNHHGAGCDPSRRVDGGLRPGTGW